MDETRITDSPDPSVADHVRRYLASDGRDGYLIDGVPNLVLTVTGRKTGTPRRTALFFGEDDGRYVLVASGSVPKPTPPAWYRNLMANGKAEVQIRADRFPVTAREATGDEYERLWRKMTELAPIYLSYPAATGTKVPIVLLTKAN